MHREPDRQRRRQQLGQNHLHLGVPLDHVARREADAEAGANRLPCSDVVIGPEGKLLALAAILAIMVLRRLLNVIEQSHRLEESA